ncbi:MAG: NAD(P)-binding protein, partial [Silvanigrellaceae bacterium]|nr:NAD(P)-binding protein [Silvanigrellaceae bacterium]
MKVAVVGAGIGGLVVATRLARAGFSVDVFDAREIPGGKMFCYTNTDGISWDTGPTIISLPNEIHDTFASLGIKETPKLLPLQEGTRLSFADGTSWQLPATKQALVSYFKQINTQTAQELEKILAVAEDIFNFAERELFSKEPPNQIQLAMKSLVSGFIKHSSIALNSYKKIIDNYLSDENLREFFYHFSSYAGVTPDFGQGALLSIAHVELSLPLVFPKGGVYSIASHLYAAALNAKVKFFFKTKILSGIPIGTEERNRGWHLITSNKELLKYDLVVSNCDPFVAGLTWLKNSDILSKKLLSHLNENKLRPSESQFVILFDKQDDTPLSHHTKIFPSSWRKSFLEVCNDKKIPEEPCIYLVWPHATDQSISPRVLFISAMAPNTLSTHNAWSASDCDAYCEKILGLCREKLNIPLQGRV